MTEAPRVDKGFRFGAFEVNPRSCELRKHGIRIKLQGKPFQILTVLLERPGDLVSRDELRRCLWPDDEYGEFDQSLNTAIKKLRQALGDSAGSPRYVETQARLGYRFVAPVEVIGAEPGVSGPSASDIAPSVPAKRRVYLWATGAVALVVCTVATYFYIGRISRESQWTAGPVASIAVLPLVNLTPGAEQDYFADGLTDALITNLAQIGALRVISRTSAMQYKGTQKLLPAIARELRVDMIVEGTVQRAGERVRVTVKLVRAPAESYLWAESYERDLRDILSLENEMAGAIARKIEIHLTPRESQQLSRAPRLNPQAYEAYLKGRFFWNIRSAESLLKGIQYFEQAISKDPDYALAYAGLADCYNMLSYYGGAKPIDSFPKAEAAAEKALLLDSRTAEAHAALGFVRLHYDWNWAGAETAFRRALELNPGYANAHHWYSHYFLATGQTGLALAHAKRALELDPLNLSITTHLGHQYIYAEQYDDAIAQVRKALEINPAAARAHAWLGRAHEGKRQFDAAETEFREAVRLSADDPRMTAGLAHLFASRGDLDAARHLLKSLETRSVSNYAFAYSLAALHVALGDQDRAFEWLDRACLARPEELIYLKADPDLKALRSDPRFSTLLRRIGLPL